jgi:hypothetical protein
MALPSTGEISSFAIFNEIRRRQPDAKEAFSLETLFGWSTKGNSGPFSQNNFLGYSHKPLCSISSLSTVSTTETAVDIRISINNATLYYAAFTLQLRYKYGSGSYTSFSQSFTADAGKSVSFIKTFSRSTSDTTLTIELLSGTGYTVGSPSSDSIGIIGNDGVLA